MPALIRNILARCNLGFTLGQKVFWTALGLIYFISPIDLLPDILFPPFGFLDDGFVLYLIYCVWKGPTLPPGSPAPTVPPKPADIIDQRGKFSPSTDLPSAAHSTYQVVATQD